MVIKNDQSPCCPLKVEVTNQAPVTIAGPLDVNITGSDAPLSVALSGGAVDVNVLSQPPATFPNPINAAIVSQPPVTVSGPVDVLSTRIYATAFLSDTSGTTTTNFYRVTVYSVNAAGLVQVIGWTDYLPDMVTLYDPVGTIDVIAGGPYWSQTAWV